MDVICFSIRSWSSREIQIPIDARHDKSPHAGATSTTPVGRRLPHIAYDHLSGASCAAPGSVRNSTAYQK